MDNGFRRSEVYDTGDIAAYIWEVEPGCCTPEIKHTRGTKELIPLTPELQHSLWKGEDDELYEQLMIRTKEIEHNEDWQVENHDTVFNFVFLEVWRGKHDKEVLIV